MGTLLLFLAGCRFDPFEGTSGGIDAPIDSLGVEQCEWQTLAKHVDDPCRYPTEGKEWAITENVTLDTTTACPSAPGDSPNTYVATQPGNNALCVLSVEKVIIAANSTLRVVGDKPLMILSHSTIEISGTIDVSSNQTGGPGAGAGRTGCTSPKDGSTGAIGGGGAGFGQAGGDGGNKPAGEGAPGNGGGSISEPTIVLAGCAGARGGQMMATEAGVGGQGGGGIQLTARESIVIAATGRVHAGGMGGQGGKDGGGGGGGSGGFIGIDAERVNVATDAQLAANGGGGGTGCDDFGTRGPRGDDAALGVTSASGGAKMGCFLPAEGGGGGAFAIGTGALGLNEGENSGGGGGGGVGFILEWSTDITMSGTASPALTKRQPR